MENEINVNTGLLWNGYDYERQAWVLEGVYQECGHPKSMHPNCCPAHQIAGTTVIEQVNFLSQEGR